MTRCRQDRSERIRFDRSEFERHVTIEKDAFVIEGRDTTGAIRVEVGIELEVADFML